MKKVYYNIGQIAENLNMRFSISLKTNKGFCMTEVKNGAVQVNNLYPSLTISIRNGGNWSPDKEFSLSRFTAIRFVDKGRKFLRQYKYEKDLFGYMNGEMYINKELAKQISFDVITEFDKKITIIPVIGKDLQMNQKYEGILLIIGQIVNNIVLTYDEFATLVLYIDKFDYDGMALKLLSVALLQYGDIESDNVIDQQITNESATWNDIKPTIDL